MKQAEERERNIKLGFFKRIKISIINFDEYHIIAGENLKSNILYLLKLMIIFATIIAVVMTIKINSTVNGISNCLKGSFPDFSIKNNTLTASLNEPQKFDIFDIDKTSIFIENGTDSDKYLNNTSLKGKKFILVLGDKIYFTIDNNTIIAFSYEEINKSFNLDSISKNEIVEILDNKYIIVTVFLYLLISMLLIYFISNLINILALAVVGMLTSRIIGLPLKFMPIYGMAMSSSTLPILLNLIYIIINTLTGFEIKHFQILYTLISYIYMIASLLLMRANFIKMDEEMEKNKRIKNADES